MFLKCTSHPRFQVSCADLHSTLVRSVPVPIRSQSYFVRDLLVFSGLAVVTVSTALAICSITMPLCCGDMQDIGTPW